MKIIRFLTPKGKVYHGVVETPDDDMALVIQGDIFDELDITSKTAKIKKLLPPVSPPNIIGIGLNYQKHAEETGIKLPEIPVMYLKATNSLIGPKDPIRLPQAGPDQVDYEAELAIVIGKEGKNIPPEKVMDHVMGYTCANDVSARDWQIRKQKTQWARGKSFDTFCPIGPWIVTKDEIPDPHNLWIRSAINGKVFQDSNTSDMLFEIPDIVSNLSQSLTLLAGTIILTGTPNGVGFTHIPPVFLRPGDEVTITIEKVGRLANPVMMEEESNY
ncbi:MAG: fumarylacetoacetate hydrolase family protein [bacterium]|nr:fumarylacetoacetate hydrolase family protein [bacterium]